MTCTESIKTCLFHKYFNFSGRASRSEYWWFIGFATSLTILGALLGPIGSGLIGLGLFVPSVAAAARRLHDCSLSGWVQLTPYIGLVLGFFLSIGSSFNGESLIFYLFFTVICPSIYLYCRKGTDGANKYGESTSVHAKIQTEIDSLSMNSNIVTKCSQCNSTINKNDTVCSNCGHSLLSNSEMISEKICPDCKEVNQKDAKYCKNCGYELEKTPI